MKRFWKDVLVAPDGVIQLDGRPVRTPGRTPLAVPFPALAEAVAAEWQDVADTIDPRLMPLTGLTNAAIDRVAPDPRAFAASLAAYAESDLLYYRADAPDELVAREEAVWDPLLAWARDRYDVHFVTITGLMHQPQPAATVARLGDAVASRPPFEMVALQPIVTISGSLIGALALAEGAVDADTLWHAATVDETWQAEQWGVDQQAAAASAAKRRDFDAAVRFLQLLG